MDASYITPFIESTKSVFGTRLNLPVDLGYRLPDGHPLFGRAKTWRGVIGAVAATAVLFGWVRSWQKQ